MTDSTTSTPSALTLPPELQQALSKVSDITALPEVTARIMDVVEDPKATAHDMHEIVKTDPALATKILKVVNSAFYGLPAQISSLDRAIVMLGLSAVKNIALAASLSQLFTPEPICDRFEPKDLWKHSIAVGVCARLLARASGKNFTEEAFVAGLVHDMGLLITHQLFPKQLREVAEHCLAKPSDFCEVEREVIGADHQAFGFAIAQKWKFPPGLRNAIAYHHNPHSLKPEFRKLATIIYVADAICCQNEYGFYLTAAQSDVTEDDLASIELTLPAVEKLLEELPELYEEAESVFGNV
jgi:putative nucleotidyltransferase with HDIG domain